MHRARATAKLDTLVAQLRDGRRAATLVFVRTKRGADRLVKRLAIDDVPAVAMHGDKSQSQREKALARFEPGASTRSWPPTSPPAASTSTASPT